MPAVMPQFFKMPLKVKVRLLTYVMVHDRKNLICSHFELDASQDAPLVSIMYLGVYLKRHKSSFKAPSYWSRGCALVLGKKVKVKHNLSLTGVDEDVIIAVLVKRNNEQRQKIKVVYEASTGEVSNSFLMKTSMVKSATGWKRAETAKS